MPKLTPENTELSGTEFPRDMFALLRCSRDAGPLEVTADLHSGEIGFIEAHLRCKTCQAEYNIENGITRLIDGPLTLEDEHEMGIIDAEHAGKGRGRLICGSYIPPQAGWRSELMDRLEVLPHLEELGSIDRCRVLELGCGDGRFTMLMAQMGARILAVDFSINALRKLARYLQSGVAPTTYKPAHRTSTSALLSQVGLVQADASHLHVAEKSFDRALSATPLDSRDERMRMYHTIADALTDGGRYVGGVEYDSLLRRLLGLPVARRYTEGGIFIEHFDFDTLRRQVAPYFSKLKLRPIRPFVPLIRRLPLPWSFWGSYLIGALPVLRHVGQILLVRAELPIRPPVEGASRPGSKLVKGLLFLSGRTKLDKFF